jgi:transcriptional regulator with XRE-family HTH domain
MGRPQKCLDEPQWRTAEFPLWRLARYLRWARGNAGLTYQELADRTQLPKATLQRAADGRTLPRPETVEAYARACGRDPVMALRWRQRAADARRPKRRAVTRSKPRSRSGPGTARRQVLVIRPARVATFDDLVEALRYLRHIAGNPTLRELAARDGSHGNRLRPSTVSDLLRRTTRRPDREVVKAFARACGQSGERLRKWEEAWSRASQAPPAGRLIPGVAQGDDRDLRSAEPETGGSYPGPFLSRCHPN